MAVLGIAGADPLDLPWLVAADLLAAGVRTGDVVADLRQACAPDVWARADVWLIFPHRATEQSWRDLEACRRAQDRALVAACGDSADAVQALRRGVRCLTLPTDSAWSVKAAVLAGLCGQPFLSPGLLHDVFSCVADALTSGAGESVPQHCLTPRELDVLRLLAGGETNAGIAGSLFIAPATVGTHVISILRKLGVTNRTQAAATAHRMGLADLPLPA